MNQRFQQYQQTHQSIIENNSQKEFEQYSKQSFQSSVKFESSSINKTLTQSIKTNEQCIHVQSDNKFYCQSSQPKFSQEIQNVEYNEILEVKDQDEFSNEFKTMRTEKKGDKKGLNINKQEYVLQQKQQQQDSQENQLSEHDQNIGKLFSNKYSSIDLKFESKLNKFIITKENLQAKKQLDEKILFQKEYKVLELMRGKNITLDIVSREIQSNKFEQIAGKFDLKVLNQKLKNKQILELYYVILLDKLNKMHELGIAHSDIKPLNIVISYENEPFFIDFGGSVSLLDQNDYKNYLNQYTPMFNINIFFEIKKIQFESQEQIKLCDKTQLVLTFLFLFCENDYQQNLFKSKLYNELFQDIIKNNIKDKKNYSVNEILNNQDMFIKNKKRECLFGIQEQKQEEETKDYQANSFYYNINQRINKLVVLTSMSSILNQADSKINIIKDGEEKIFLIDNKQSQIPELQDIEFQKDIYNVKRIDKFNILLIYFLDKQGYNLNIHPSHTLITPQYQMKEYQEISKKYNINEHFLKIEKIGILNYQTDMFLLNQNAKENQTQKIKINIQTKKQMKLFLEDSQNLDPDLELNITFQIQIIEIIKLLNDFKYYLPHHHLQNFEWFDSYAICQFNKIISGDSQKPSINVKLNLSNIIINDEIPKQKMNINNILLVIKRYYEIKQIQYIYKYISNDEKIEDNSNIIENQVNHILIQTEYNQIQQYPVYIQIEESFHSNEYIDSARSYYIKFLKQQNFKNFVLFDDYIIKTQIERQIISILEIEYPRQKIIIKIYHCKIHQIEMFEQIKEILDLHDIEIIIVNCLISNQTAKILKNIYEMHDNVQYEFQDGKINQQQQEEYFNIRFQFKVEYNTNSFSKPGLKIIFNYCDFGVQKEQLQKYYQDQERQYEKNKYDSFQRPEKEYDNQQEQSQRNENIEKHFTKNKQQFFPYFKELKENPINKQTLKFMNKEKEINDIKDIDTLIKDIQNKNHYSDIKIIDQTNRYNSFVLFESEKYCIKCDSEDIDTLNQFYQLSHTILNNYNCFQIINYIYNPFMNINTSISQEIKYQTFTIIQHISYQFATDWDLFIITYMYGLVRFNYDDTLDFQHEKFLSQRYCICLNDNSLYLREKNDLIRDLFVNNKLRDSFNHFSKYSIINSLLQRQIFKNQNQIIQIDFESIQISDNCFHVFFQEIEKLFPFKKIYNLKQCNLTGKSLFNIYQTITNYQLTHLLYFDLLGNKINYDDFKKFIYKTLNDQNNDFKIFVKINTFNYQSVLHKFKTDFKNKLQIAFIDKLFQFEGENFSPNHFKGIQIELNTDAYEFKEEFDNYQKYKDYRVKNKIEYSSYKQLLKQKSDSFSDYNLNELFKIKSFDNENSQLKDEQQQSNSSFSVDSSSLDSSTSNYEITQEFEEQSISQTSESNQFEEELNLNKSNSYTSLEYMNDLCQIYENGFEDENEIMSESSNSDNQEQHSKTSQQKQFSCQSFNFSEENLIDQYKKGKLNEYLQLFITQNLKENYQQEKYSNQQIELFANYLEVRIISKNYFEYSHFKQFILSQYCELKLKLPKTHYIYQLLK